MATVDVFKPSPIDVTDPSKFDNVITIMDGGTPLYGFTNNKKITVGDVLTSILEDFKYNIPFPVDYRTPEHLFLMKGSIVMYDFDAPVDFKDNKASFQTVFIKEHFNHEPNLLENVRENKKRKIESIKKKLSTKEILKEMKQQEYRPDITVVIELLTNQRITVSINPHDTVQHLKEKIHSIIKTPPTDFTLTFARKRLEDDTYIYETNMMEGDKIYLIRRLRGGMFHVTSGRNGAYLPLKQAYFSLDSKPEPDGKSRKPKKPTIRKDKYRQTFYEYKN